MKRLSNKMVRFVVSIYLYTLLLTNPVFSQVNVSYDTNSTLLKISVTRMKQVIKDLNSPRGKTAQTNPAGSIRLACLRTGQPGISSASQGDRQPVRFEHSWRNRTTA